MKAKLRELEGKYYGTKVDLGESTVNFWLTFNGCDNSFVPSDRELESANITREQWNNNEVVLVEDFFGGLCEGKARDIVEACDHFEDQHSYLVAKAFVEMYNKDFKD